MSYVGKAGEALVEARLLALRANVARPAVDERCIDLLAFTVTDRVRVVPIQVKTASQTGYTLQRSWFETPDLALVWVWRLHGVPEFFIFGGIEDAEAALGNSADTMSWRDRGGYSVSGNVSPARLERLAPFQNAWHKILTPLGIDANIQAAIDVD